MRGDTLLDKGVQMEIEISESDKHHIIVIKTIYGVHTSETRRTFPKLEDGCVLIPLRPRASTTRRFIKIRNVEFYEADGKVMVKSTTNKNLYSDLDEFIRSWYSFWDAHGEGILI
jgi:ABC-type phosphate transport system auxiliary subunit